jgi:hypothetical protein
MSEKFANFTGIDCAVKRNSFPGKEAQSRERPDKISLGESMYQGR